MKLKNCLIIALVLAILLIPFSFAHEGEEEMGEHSAPDPVRQVFVFDSLIILGWSFFAVMVLIIVSLLKGDKMPEHGKKIFFIAMVVLIGFSTLYLAGETVYENLVSESGGPVHWHADFELWICGEKIAFKESEGLENKVGTNEFHHHNDNRIHIEGTVIRLEDVSLGKFFESIEGKFTQDEIEVIAKDGTVIDKHNGDECNGVPGTLKFFVNGEPNNEFGNYVIKPFSLVPPGDVLRIEFS